METESWLTKCMKNTNEELVQDQTVWGLCSSSPLLCCFNSISVLRFWLMVPPPSTDGSSGWLMVSPDGGVSGGGAADEDFNFKYTMVPGEPSIPHGGGAWHPSQQLLKVPHVSLRSNIVEQPRPLWPRPLPRDRRKIPWRSKRICSIDFEKETTVVVATTCNYRRVNPHSEQLDSVFLINRILIFEKLLQKALKVIWFLMISSSVCSSDSTRSMLARLMQ